MSNSITGGVFAQIIDRVVEASQNDFEESGVEQQTLLDMKEIWKKKLSALRVAQMPWDPAPPQLQISNPPTVPSNDAKPPTAQQKTSTTLQPSTQQYASEVRVKQEPGNGYESSMPGYNYNILNGSVAQQRATALLHMSSAPQPPASASAYSSHGNVAFSGQQRPMNLQMPPNRQQQVKQQQGPPNHPQQQQSRQTQQNQIQQQDQKTTSVYSAQKDGAGDAEDQWNSLKTARCAQPDGARAMADGVLRAQLEDKMSVIESGLLQPVESRIDPTGKKRRLVATGGPPRVSAIAQLDGEFGLEGEEVNDDEAINSDLDDSDEELIQEGDDDGPQGETMICTYDKVQRVKNKWKCTLKDGVLSTGGKDYLFHKAQGEFEW